MTHTLHQQSANLSTIDQTISILKNELGFIQKEGSESTDVTELILSNNSPKLTINSTPVITLRPYNVDTPSIEIADRTEAYIGRLCWHNSADLSVRYFIWPDSSAEVMVWAQDISDEWTAITTEGLICGTNSHKNSTSFSTSGIPNSIVNSNNIYTISKVARPDNGKEFKGLYIVLSAQFFDPTETLVSMNGEVYRIVSILGHGFSYDARRPVLAFKVNDE